MAEVPSETPKRRSVEVDEAVPSGGARRPRPAPAQPASPRHQDEEVDEASEESFPASDAPGTWSGPPGT